ncbi:hypothetical protein D3C72_1958480 [compost metagenome]
MAHVPVGRDLLVDRPAAAAVLEKPVQGLVQAFGATVGVIPPVGGPDAQDVPSQASQNLFAHLVPVAGGRGAVIGRAVAFHPGQIGPGKIGMADSKVDPEA